MAHGDRELERIRRRRIYGTDTWEDRIREREILREQVDREFDREDEEAFQRRFGVKPADPQP